MAIATDMQITSSSAPRSWAAIVKGKEVIDSCEASPVPLFSAPEADDACIQDAKDDNLSPVQPSNPAPLVPAGRGRRQCWCRGEVIAMLGHFGWLLPWAEIDHPDLGKNGGRIYVNANDIADGMMLTAGDTVMFNLYVDRHGLGAESCKLEQRASTNLNADAPEFTMLSAMRMDAEVFEPSAYGCVPDYSSKAPGLDSWIQHPDDPDGPVNLNAVQSLLAINPNMLDLLADSDSDDDDGKSSNDGSGYDGDVMVKGARTLSMGSQSTGVPSGSSTPTRSISPPPGLASVAKGSVMRPPGLEVWPCSSPDKGAFSPPPGLCLPVMIPVVPASACWFQGFP